DSNELSQAYLEKNQIDLIVTNYTEYITEYAQNIDYLLLKTFPDDYDWEALEAKLNTNFNS
ncbi:M protein trans-acting positive regulator, partial [Listeria monocytogenes]|nr:M protein trans-acting positive regulator [Listeria monocytogenes]